jgi:hypothetical protein
MVSEGAFMERSLDEAWQPLDLIVLNSKTWSVEYSSRIYSKGRIKLDPKYVKTFLETGSVEDLIGEFQVDPDVIALAVSPIL